MKRLRQKISLIETPKLYEIIQLLMNNFDEDAGTVLNAALDELEKRISENDFIKFRDSICSIEGV